MKDTTSNPKNGDVRVARGFDKSGWIAEFYDDNYLPGWRTARAFFGTQFDTRTEAVAAAKEQYRKGRFAPKWEKS